MYIYIYTCTHIPLCLSLCLLQRIEAPQNHHRLAAKFKPLGRLSFPFGPTQPSQEKIRKPMIQWVDLRGNLQETIDFPMKYMVFSCNRSYEIW